MNNKFALTLVHCLIGPALILGGLYLAVQTGQRDPVVGFAAMVIAVVLPVIVMTRIAWAAGYAAGQRDRDSDRAAD